MWLKKLYPITLILLGIVVVISNQPLRKGSVYIDFTEVKYIVGPFLILYGLFWLLRLMKKSD